MTSLLCGLVFFITYFLYPIQEQYWAKNTSRGLFHHIREFFTFFSAFIKNPTLVGAIAPSSMALASTITKFIDSQKPKKHILEVGAGTGSFTQFIIHHLNPDDTLDIIERDAEFCAILKEKFGHLPNVTIFNTSFLDWHAPRTYDYIISGLPINSFEATSLQRVLDKYTFFLKPDGVYAYSEYLGIPTLKASWLYLFNQERYLTFLEERQTNRDFRSLFSFYTEEIVWHNMFPSRVITCWQTEDVKVLV